MSRLLVVDDHARDLEASASLLARGGFEVDCCVEGAEALERLHRDPAAYDGLVVDIFMPEVDGLEMIRDLRRRGYRGAILALSDVPVYGRFEPLRVARLLGADAALCKPLTDEVFAVIEKLLPARQAA